MMMIKLLIVAIWVLATLVVCAWFIYESKKPPDSHDED
jgi:hypothetical protein